MGMNVRSVFGLYPTPFKKVESLVVHSMNRYPVISKAATWTEVKKVAHIFRPFDGRIVHLVDNDNKLKESVNLR